MRTPDFKTVIFYTTETGGVMQPYWGDRSDYDRIKEDGTITRLWDEKPKPLKMIAFADVVEVYDFDRGDVR